MKRSLSLVFLCASFALTPIVADATVITYDAVQIGGSTWQYDYSVTNNSLSAPIDEFTIFYSLAKYSNLTVQRSPGSWDSLVAQPDPLLPSSGFFDSLAIAGGLAPGKTLSGFSTQFTYKGTGAPGSQLFNIVDSNTIAILDFGNTQPGRGGMAAPEIDPSSFASAMTLLMFGVAALSGRRAQHLAE
jgi:hypothetical protein